MSKTGLSTAICLMLACMTLTNAGCAGISLGGNLGAMGIPIPVSPYFQKRLEDRAWEQERYSRVPILPPLTAGGPARAWDEPSDDEVMRALEKARRIQGGLPLLHETQRNDVRIITEKIADYVDPPRVVPLIGPVQLHHAHYKCTVYFSETINVGWPIPHRIQDDEVIEVIYIDHNHFHMVGKVDGGSGNY
ncbi:MAG: hypothetical protein ACI9HK_002183 [Pirellulaceae bacterium]|jgi:hypothetical protein